MAYPRNFDWSSSTSSASSTAPYLEGGNTFVAERLSHFHLPKSVEKEMGQNVANQIDKYILDDLLRQANYKNTTHLKAVKFNPENLWSEPNV